MGRVMYTSCTHCSDDGVSMENVEVIFATGEERVLVCISQATIDKKNLHFQFPSLTLPSSPPFLSSPLSNYKTPHPIMKHFLPNSTKYKSS